MKGSWIFLVRALLVLSLSVAVVGLVGCGDDDDSGDNGGDGDGDTGDGDGDTGDGDGDTGDGDGDTGDGDGDTGDGDGDGGTCEEQVVAAGQPEACATCLCASCEEDVLTACNEGCWGLILCVGENCLDAEDQTVCATTNCLEFLAEAAPATEVGECAFAGDDNDCSEPCGAGGGDGDADGGTGDAG